MRGKIRKKLLKSGKFSLYIDYYPPVWNPQKKIYTRREFLDLHLHAVPSGSLERKENLLYMEIAEKIFIKRMKGLMLDANGLFNKDLLEGDFFAYALDFIRNKQRAKIDTAHYEASIKYLKRWVENILSFGILMTGFYGNLRNTCLQRPH